mmetsp:Transcript_4076/g.8787  ORF Transcript_4076/g.8787 Transcript_4076/m.8787 type:complete len:426 (-) Transcript_4076:72-1349(-)
MRCNIGKVLHNVTEDSNSGLHNLVKVLGGDLKVHNTTTALALCALSLRGKCVYTSSDTVIKTCTKSKDKIGILHGVVSESRSVHTKHLERKRAALVKSTETLHGGGDGDVCLLCELLEHAGSVELALHDTLASVDDRALGTVDHLSDKLEIGSARSSDALLVEELHLLLLTNSHLRRRVRDLLQHHSGDILGKVDKHRSRSSAGGDFEGLVDASREVFDILDHNVPLGAGPADTHDITLLESIRSDGGSRHLASEHDERGTVHVGIHDGGDGVGGARTRGHEHDTGFASGTSVTFGHVACALLVASKDELEGIALENGVEDGKDGTTRVAKDGVHTVLAHELVKDLGTGHAHKAGIVAGRLRGGRGEGALRAQGGLGDGIIGEVGLGLDARRGNVGHRRRQRSGEGTETGDAGGAGEHGQGPGSG